MAVSLGSKTDCPNIPTDNLDGKSDGLDSQTGNLDNQMDSLNAEVDSMGAKGVVQIGTESIPLDSQIDCPWQPGISLDWKKECLNI